MALYQLAMCDGFRVGRTGDLGCREKACEVKTTRYNKDTNKGYMRVKQEAQTNINGASQKGASVQGLLNDFEEVGICFAQVVILSNAASEVFETLSSAASRKGLVASI